MSKKIDLEGKKYEDISFFDKQYLFDRGKLPSDWVSQFIQESAVSLQPVPLVPQQVAPVVVVPKTLEEMSKKELQDEARSRDLPFKANTSYEKLLSMLQEDDENEGEEADDDEEEDSEEEDSEDDDDDDE